MAENRSKEIHRINYLNSEMNALYHQASVKVGVSDSVGTILYTLYDVGGSCPLRDICTASGISKQTLNSALRALEARQLLRMEPHSGRTKLAILTEAGMDYARQTAGKIFQAEMDAFGSWTDEEICTYFRLMEKYVRCLGDQIAQLS